LTRTAADGVVIENLAVSIQTTETRARIAALLINASQMSRAFRADETLWTTMWRSALITRAAGTNCTIVHYTANAVRTAW